MRRPSFRRLLLSSAVKGPLLLAAVGEFSFYITNPHKDKTP